MTWNPHKMMAVPLQCSALLVREEVRSEALDHYSLSIFNDCVLFKCSIFTPCCFCVAGFDAELQPDAGVLSVPAGQTLRPELRHGRQGAAVWTPRRHLQALAHVAGEGTDAQRDLDKKDVSTYKQDPN